MPKIDMARTQMGNSKTSLFTNNGRTIKSKKLLHIGLQISYWKSSAVMVMPMFRTTVSLVVLMSISPNVALCRKVYGCPQPEPEVFYVFDCRASKLINVSGSSRTVEVMLCSAKSLSLKSL